MCVSDRKQSVFCFSPRKAWRPVDTSLMVLCLNFIHTDIDMLLIWWCWTPHWCLCCYANGAALVMVMVSIKLMVSVLVMVMVLVKVWVLELE